MSVFLSDEIIAFLAAELVIIALMGVSQVHVVHILRKWDFVATTNLQYLLEKKNYLVNTILTFAVACKIVLF
ncbi:MAG: hypothetical protein ACFNYB_02170, partial [Campylobacter sp.]